MYAYGPVPSRRFGRSVGVSPIPEKTCSYSCVYCQLGRTKKLTSVRQHFFPEEAIWDDIVNVVNANNNKIDYITFVGDGEPTLSLDLGTLIHRCKQSFPYTTAVITNGSLLWMDEVRRELCEADVVNITMPTSDAATFRRMHRPHPSIHFEQVWEGIRQFAAMYHGEIWAEVMLVDTVNTEDESLMVLKEHIDAIKPARTYVMVPTRPPAEAWVKIPSPEVTMKAFKILGGEDITRPEDGVFGLGEFSSAEEALLEICQRHPLRLSQAKAIEEGFTQKALDELLAKGRLRTVEYQNISYVLPSEFVVG